MQRQISLFAYTSASRRGPLLHPRPRRISGAIENVPAPGAVLAGMICTIPRKTRFGFVFRSTTPQNTPPCGLRWVRFRKRTHRILPRILVVTFFGSISCIVNVRRKRWVRFAETMFLGCSFSTRGAVISSRHLLRHSTQHDGGPCRVVALAKTEALGNGGPVRRPVRRPVRHSTKCDGGSLREGGYLFSCPDHTHSERPCPAKLSIYDMRAETTLRAKCLRGRSGCRSLDGSPQTEAQLSWQRNHARPQSRASPPPRPPKTWPPPCSSKPKPNSKNEFRKSRPKPAIPSSLNTHQPQRFSVAINRLLY